MTTITAGNSEGTYGRCDDKCHLAKNPKCHCICGGRYHGANLKQGGLRGVMEQYEAEVVEYAKNEAVANGWNLKINSLVDLFGQQTLVMLALLYVLSFAGCDHDANSTGAYKEITTSTCVVVIDGKEHPC